MMELRRHIEILLLSNDCVIVPHLGGFMAHHVSARYDKGEGMFIPPYRMLGFNPQLTMSDSLLAQSYADTYEISFPEAVERIEHEVRLLKQRIETDGQYVFTDLGILKVNKDGRYEFEPCPTSILTPSLYGLGAFELSQLNVAAPSVVLPTAPMGILHPASTPQKSKLATIMSHIDERDYQEEEKTISIKVSLLRNLAVTAVAAVALILFARPVPASDSGAMESAREEASMVTMAEVPASEEASAPSAISIMGSLESVSRKIEDIQASQEAVVPEAGRHTIVLAYSIPLENARMFLADVRAKGARKAVLFEYKGQNVIAYGSYSSSEEAYGQLQELLNAGSVASGWIMQVK